MASNSTPELQELAARVRAARLALRDVRTERAADAARTLRPDAPKSGESARGSESDPDVSAATEDKKP